MPFVPGVFRFSCQTYFRLLANDMVRLQDAQDAKRLAFFGDSLLQFECITYLRDKYCSAPLGELSLRKIALVRNTTLESLFDGVFSADLAGAASQGWASHKKGTVVEAAIQLSYERNGESARKLVREMLEWVDGRIDAQAAASPQAWSDGAAAVDAEADLDPDSVGSDPRRAPPSSALVPVARPDQEFLLALASDLRRIQPSPERPRAAADRPSEAPRRAPAGLGGHDHETIPVTWTSGSGATYVSEFYRCCGKQVGFTSPQCPRPMPYTRRHSGTLALYSSRRSPGGKAPSGTSLDHLPICNQPSWTCCGKLSDEEGCVQL